MTEYREIPAGGTFNTQLVCLDCGALVWDPAIHDDFHERMGYMVQAREAVQRAFEHIEGQEIPVVLDREWHEKRDV